MNLNLGKIHLLSFLLRESYLIAREPRGKYIIERKASFLI